jgi:formylglycine-generating enzyme required for sulfatase activity
MAGNVWEWMENWHDSKKQYKSLRGGSWYDIPVSLRCRARSYYFPVLRDFVSGFRVVRPSPVFLTI